VGEANAAASAARKGDLVFLDPPYSAVHYSRFYHVLETIARGTCGDVSGVGRYPPPDERPSSDYSMKGTARDAMSSLLARLAEREARVVLTFPQGPASNGIDGEELLVTCREWFDVDAKVIASRFSTLGGTEADRGARRRTGELIARLVPR
jgi:hypothetical protein